MQQVWLARTQPGADVLAAALEAVGIYSWCASVIEIVPLRPVLVSAWPKRDSLGEASATAVTPQPVQEISQVPPADLVCAFSPHAVEAYLASDWRTLGVPHYAIGSASLEHLRRAGLDVSAPDIATSEGLIELLESTLPKPEEGGTAGMTIWLLSGAGGRELVANYLRNAGHRVFKFAFYERRPVRSLDVRPQNINAVVVGSQQSLEVASELWQAAGGGRDVNVFVPSMRVAQKGYALGFKNVHNVQSTEVAATVAQLRKTIQ